MTRRVDEDMTSQRGHSKPPGFFLQFFYTLLNFCFSYHNYLNDHDWQRPNTSTTNTPTNPQPTQRVKTGMAATTAAVAARDVSRLELLVCFILLLLH